MNKKPIVIFSLASAGMGHATRDVPIISRLSKNYEVHIFCSGNANKWLSKQFQHVHQNHAIKGVSKDGQISLFLVLARALVEFPKSLFYILRIAFFILKNHPKAVISDFEAHSIYASRLVRFLYKIPIISCDHWTTLRLSENNFNFDENENAELQKWQKTIKMVTPFADHYLVHGTMKTTLNEGKAKYVPTPVRDIFLEAGKKTSKQGPVVVSMGHLAPPSLSNILEKSQLNFIIFGSDNPRKQKNIEYRTFDEEEYLKALQNSPFVIVSANSSAIDALALKKPLLYQPTKGQFEQYYCGKMFEFIGVAKLVKDLTAKNINQFAKEVENYEKHIASLDIFDNDLLCEEIKNAISEKI